MGSEYFLPAQIGPAAHPASCKMGTDSFSEVKKLWRGPGSVVGIATAYGLDGPGIESRWGEIFRTSPDRP